MTDKLDDAIEQAKKQFIENEADKMVSLAHQGAGCKMQDELKGIRDDQVIAIFRRAQEKTDKLAQFPVVNFDAHMQSNWIPVGRSTTIERLATDVTTVDPNSDAPRTSILHKSGALQGDWSCKTFLKE